MKKITVILLSLCLALCLAVMFISCDNGPETGMSGGGCNHEYGEEFFVSSSCTENGVLRKICKLCKEPYDTPTEAPGHTWITENEKLSSCTSDGYRNLKCEKCGTMNYEELKATGHKYEYGVSSQPTQESTGTLAYDCINCSNNGTAEMPALTDSAYTKEVVDADTTHYTYTYEGNAVKFTVSSYVIYPVYSGENPLKFELYRITDYTGSNKNLTLPTTWEGGYIVEIDERAFQNCEGIESVTIPKFSFSYTIDDVREEYREELEKNIQECLQLGATLVNKENVEDVIAIVDIVVLSPGVAIDSEVPIIARKLRKNIIGELELGYYFMRGAIVGVTGTNGKTTTCSMIDYILNNAGYKCNLAGNIGIPLTKVCKDSQLEGVSVVEVSSFQLEYPFDNNQPLHFHLLLPRQFRQALHKRSYLLFLLLLILIFFFLLYLQLMFELLHQQQQLVQHQEK